MRTKWFQVLFTDSANLNSLLFLSYTRQPTEYYLYSALDILPFPWTHKRLTKGMKLGNYSVPLPHWVSYEHFANNAGGLGISAYSHVMLLQDKGHIFFMDFLCALKSVLKMKETPIFV